LEPIPDPQQPSRLFIPIRGRENGPHWEDGRLFAFGEKAGKIELGRQLSAAEKSHATSAADAEV
jgi:hypothetical protein